MKILANDGIANAGQKALEEAGFEVLTNTVAQEQLETFINDNDVVGLLVRSATKVRQPLIDACPGLKLIGRGGVGMDNIDVEYARSKGLSVINTHGASSASVAELVFAHLFSSVRFLHDSNRNMPLEGDSNFKGLKKAYAKGRELRGRKLGIIGFGRIGQAVAKIAIGVGMEVLPFDKSTDEVELSLKFYTGDHMKFNVKTVSLDTVLTQSDFITLHVPHQGKPLLGKEEFEKMKDGVGLVNAARGGVIDEEALIQALESGKISFAGLDVFENEPKPSLKVLMNRYVSLSPHIGAATEEAQERIGLELAEQIIDILKK